MTERESMTTDVLSRSKVVIQKDGENNMESHEADEEPRKLKRVIDGGHSVAEKTD